MVVGYHHFRKPPYVNQEAVHQQFVSFPLAGGFKVFTPTGEDKPRFDSYFLIWVARPPAIALGGSSDLVSS